MTALDYTKRMRLNSDLNKLPSGSYVVAVSGGVDSVVLLDMVAGKPGLDLVVAHFDHGIRDDSADDAEFVRGLAAKYNLAFEVRREDLGKNASEELARSRRYEFLHSVADKYKARIMTAHHTDDVIETIAINLTRGTGWRGLAVLDSDVVRPLLNMTKSEIKDYALQNKLTWHEDSTNASDAYLRNRLRRKLDALPEDSKRQVLALWSSQKDIKKQIESELSQLLTGGPEYSRYFFSHLDSLTETEVLRSVTQAKLTRPQTKRLVVAIKTARPGSVYDAGSGVKIQFTSRNFTVKLVK